MADIFLQPVCIGGRQHTEINTSVREEEGKFVGRVCLLCSAEWNAKLDFIGYSNPIKAEPLKPPTKE